MKLIDDILKYKSLSVVGLAKNVGKTETLNFILRNLQNSTKTVAITSIGIDGETTDAVTLTEKPEITVYPNMLFTTAEKLFMQKRPHSEILDISIEETIFGRLVTARTLQRGKVLLSGAANTAMLRKIISRNATLGADLTIADGALSRLSLASPATTEAMILATGAALSSNIDTLVRQTKFICQLIDMEEFELPIGTNTDNLTSDIYYIKDREIIPLGLPSALAINSLTKTQLDELKESRQILIIGILSNKIIDFLIAHQLAKSTTIIARDFSTIFVSDIKYNLFCKLGGEFRVLKKTNLLALTVNPTSPQGITLNSEVLCSKLSEATGKMAFDVRK